MSEASQPRVQTTRCWMDMSTAPRSTEDVWVLLADGSEIKAHYACDLSGSEQPAFKGWFQEESWGYSQVAPVKWAPITQCVAEGR